MAVVRDIDPATLAAISGRAFFPVVLVYLDWPDAPVYAHSNLGLISYGGQSWRGVGDFGKIGLPDEAMGLASSDATVGLMGLGDKLNDYLDDDIRGRDAIIYFGAVTERDGNTLVGAPIPIFVGTMDAKKDTLKRESDNITVRGVSISITPGPSQRSAAGVYHSDEDQKRRFPGDTAGRLILQAYREGSTLRWPQ
ncbi:hypothetical protein PVT71_18265 [Salipiger sp. H15]|uniref:Uncharacterized protein n=1 Tax=Alloyangia sp. H15 TaxID=3029062 RepID=A0AAU8APW9_9RHOB